MSAPPSGTFHLRIGRLERELSWTGLIAGCVGGGLGLFCSIGFPGQAWGWALTYLCVALLFSPSSVGVLWFTYRDGRWHLVRSKRDLSAKQLRFFFGLSVVLAVWALAFFLVWVGHLAWVGAQ
jgi:hypothetical protein